MPIITPERIHAFAPACDAQAVSDALNAAAQRFTIDTPARIVQHLAQLHEETGGFTVTEENLYYTSARRIAEVWPTRFTVASAAAYVRNPQELANKVYGYRGGNTLPDSGWRWHGRGYLQTTFYNNYKAAADALGRPYTTSPELLLLPPDAALAAAYYWSSRGCNALADAGDIITITERVNGASAEMIAEGGANIVERRAQLARAEAIFI